MRGVLALLLSFGSPACGGTPAAGAPPPATAPALPEGFWAHWGDGRAELDAYSLVTPRYGELRRGRVVLVFVTEDFTDSQRVKSDGGHRDEYPVLKLNEARDFQTGIYDYHVMTSAFVHLDPGSVGRPAKVSMSMQEWCGHVYEQLLPGAGALAWESHSYFDGEADRQRSFEVAPGGVLLDDAPILVRGLVGEWVGPGRSVEVPAFPTLASGRYAHRAPEWTRATVSRSAGDAEVTVPAGTFRVHEVTISVNGGSSTTWQVESAWPHRIVRWTTSDGEVAELLGTERRSYWAEHAEGDERWLQGLGLPVPPGSGSPTP